MLLSLHIENIAVVKRVDLDFTQGFAALTGETGAGKSVIIDSIHLLLGKKVDKDLIRTGESSMMVSGLFGNFSDTILEKIREIGADVDDDGNILVQRTVSRDGKVPPAGCAPGAAVPRGASPRPAPSSRLRTGADQGNPTV